jgi:hypothetical protein
METTTDEKQLALREVRQAMYERLSSFSFTEEMLKSRSVFQLLCLLQLVTGHRNWIGQFTHTAWTLDQIFGYDVIREEPKHNPEAEKVIVN